MYRPSSDMIKPSDKKRKTNKEEAECDEIRRQKAGKDGKSYGKNGARKQSKEPKRKRRRVEKGRGGKGHGRENEMDHHHHIYVCACARACVCAQQKARGRAFYKVSMSVLECY